MVTQGDLNAAIDHVRRLFQKYYKLLLVADRILLQLVSRE
jgi:hypothetical protein